LAVPNQLVRSLDEIKVVMYNDRLSVSQRDTVVEVQMLHA
jgi:hypothetical protein